MEFPVTSRVPVPVTELSLPQSAGTPARRGRFDADSSIWQLGASSEPEDKAVSNVWAVVTLRERSN